MFENDSTPKLTASSRRTKYGVNKKTSLFRKNYELMTAPKVNVLSPIKEDSLYSEDEGDFLVSDFADTDSLAVDSLGIDSIAVAPAFAKADESKDPQYKYRYRREDSFNQEQVYYNKYYGKLFIDNRPPPPTQEEIEAMKLAEDEAAANLDSLSGDGSQKKSLFGGRKKNKKEVIQDEESVVDSETFEQAQEAIEETEAIEVAPAEEVEEKPEEQQGD